MKKIKVLSLITIAFFALSLTSCLSSGHESFTYEKPLSGSQNFSYITDLSTGDEYIVGTGADYNFSFEATDHTLSIYATGLQLRSGAGSYTFRIDDISFKYDKFGAIAATQGTYTDPVNNVTISNLDLNYQQRSIGMMNMDVYTFTYTIDNRYKVRVIQTSTFYFGETEIKDINTSDVELNNKTVYYCVTFDPKTLEGTTIESSIWAYNILLPGQKDKALYEFAQPLKATFTADGYKLSAINAKIFKDNSKDPFEMVASNIQADGSFILSDDGEQRNPNLRIGITLDNKYRITSSVGLSMTKELAEEFEKIPM